MTWLRICQLWMGDGMAEAPTNIPHPPWFWDKNHLSTINVMKYPIDGGCFYKLWRSCWTCWGASCSFINSISLEYIMGLYIYIYLLINIMGISCSSGYISQDLPMISPSGCRRVRGASAVSLNTWNVRWAARHPWILALVVDEIRDSTIQNDGHLGAWWTINNC